MASPFQIVAPLLACATLGTTGCRSQKPAVEPNFVAVLSWTTALDLPESLAEELKKRSETLALAASLELNSPAPGQITIHFHAQDETEAQSRIETLTRSGRLSVRAVHDQNAFLLADRSQIPPDHGVLTHFYRFDDGSERTEELVVSRTEILSSAHIKRATADPSADGVIHLFLTTEGGKAIANATKSMQKGRSRLAISLDERIISAPVVDQILSTQFIIQGFPSFEETKAVAAALSQPLSVKLQIDSVLPLAPEASKP